MYPDQAIPVFDSMNQSMKRYREILLLLGSRMVDYFCLNLTPKRMVLLEHLRTSLCQRMWDSVAL